MCSLYMVIYVAVLIEPRCRWGQIYILDSLLRYVPERHEDAELMAERVVVQLGHANSAVVLTSIKVLLYLMNYMENRKLIDYLCKKMGPPLGAIPFPYHRSSKSYLLLSIVTILSSGPEVQYVALRNILLIIQRRPSVLKNDVKVFFCKYNDPIYVKLAKLEIMYRLAREENAREVLAELQEYVFSPRETSAINPTAHPGTPRKWTSTLSVNLCAPSVVSLSRWKPPQTLVSKPSSSSSRPK